jgi:hypothetical protein
MTAKTKEVTKEPQITWSSFLRKETVSVRPVEASGKWSTLLVKGQDKRKDPFIYNKVKRSYQVPLNDYRRGGGVKAILDDQERRHIKKYYNKYPNGMTQKEFFENELGVDLNHTLPIEENFWRSDRRGRITMTKEGVSLNLNLSIDMLKYLILLSNKKLISPSYDDRLLKATYEFMMVDDNKVTSKKVAAAELKARAYTKFAEVTSNKHKMIGFIKSLGRTIPSSHTEDWLKNEIINVLDESSENFLAVVDHPQYDQRIFVQEAIDAGAIKKMSERRYVLDNGIELGELTDTINYLDNPDNQEVKMRIKTQVELSKK